MREKILKRLDLAIAVALIALLPIAAFLTWLRRKQRKGTAVVRPGGMGDLICLQMALEHVPELQEDGLSFFIDGRSAAWAHFQGMHAPRYDQHFVRTLFRSIGRFHKVIVTEQHYGAAAAYALLLSGGQLPCYGFSTQRLATLMSRVVPYDPIAEHEVSAFARLLAAASGRALKRLTLSELTRARLRPIAVDSTWLCIAGRGIPSREFDAATLARWVAIAAGGGRITIAFQPSDLEFARSVAADLPNAELFHGTFDALCDALSGAKEVLTVDGGMVHVCSYFGIPTRALFTSGIVEKWRPLALGSSVALSPEDLSCRPCVRFGQAPNCTAQYACKKFPLEAFRNDAH